MKLLKLAGVLVLALSFYSASASAQQSDEGPSDKLIPDIVQKIDSEAKKHAKNIGELNVKLKENLKSLNETKKNFESMRESIRELISKFGRDSDIYKLTQSYLEYAEKERIQAAQSENSRVRELAKQWDSQIEKTNNVLTSFSDLRIKLTKKLKRMDEDSEYIITLIKLRKYEAGLNEISKTVEGIQAIDNDLADIMKSTEDIESEGAAQ